MAPLILEERLSSPSVSEGPASSSEHGVVVGESGSAIPPISAYSPAAEEGRPARVLRRVARCGGCRAGGGECRRRGPDASPDHAVRAATSVTSSATSLPKVTAGDGSSDLYPAPLPCWWLLYQGPRSLGRV